MSAKTPDWLRVGAEVGTYCIGSGLYSSTKRSVISKIGKRDVVLEDGRRFNINRLSASTTTWGPTTYLTSVDDPTFLRSEAQDRRHRISRAVEQLMGDWRRGDDSALDKARRLLGDES